MLIRIKSERIRNPSAAAASGWAEPTRNLGVQLTLLQPGGQIMSTTLLLAHPDLKTQRHLCTPLENPQIGLQSFF